MLDLQAHLLHELLDPVVDLIGAGGQAVVAHGLGNDWDLTEVWDATSYGGWEWTEQGLAAGRDSSWKWQHIKRLESYLPQRV